MMVHVGLNPHLPIKLYGSALLALPMISIRVGMGI
jgi:hypothetical protein